LITPFYLTPSTYSLLPNPFYPPYIHSSPSTLLTLLLIYSITQSFSLNLFSSTLSLSNHITLISFNPTYSVTYILNLFTPFLTYSIPSFYSYSSLLFSFFPTHYITYILITQSLLLNPLSFLLSYFLSLPQYIISIYHTPHSPTLIPLYSPPTYFLSTTLPFSTRPITYILFILLLSSYPSPLSLIQSLLFLKIFSLISLSSILFYYLSPLSYSPSLLYSPSP
jgi:hypothetical protein